MDEFIIGFVVSVVRVYLTLGDPEILLVVSLKHLDRPSLPLFLALIKLNLELLSTGLAQFVLICGEAIGRIEVRQGDKVDKEVVHEVREVPLQENSIGSLLHRNEAFASLALSNLADAEGGFLLLLLLLLYGRSGFLEADDLLL